MQRKLIAVGVMLVLLVTGALAQRITGSISGTVTDPQGAVVTGAKVTVSNDTTGYKKETTTSETGAFNVSDIRPAIYKVTIEAQGFAPYITTIPVRVGVDTPVIAKLNVGGETTEVTVAADATTIDVVQATVQGHVQSNQIDSLPLNGRNFLDLAQLQPGVQVVDGGSFDPTKNQFAGVSVGGRSGRVTRIQVDGVDLTDETVGTTVMNISNESISEFGIAQSSLDPSTDVTSSGAVNIASKTGSNDIHGAGFFQWRDESISADQRLVNTTPKPPFDREVWGGNVGGPFMRDKMFWHVHYEQFSQDSQRFTNVPEFPQFTGEFNAPVDETMAGGRLDWNISTNVRGFYSFRHNHNVGVTGFGNRDLAAFSNLNNTNSHAAGVDYTTGRWTHSGRFSFLNFNNFVSPANTAAGTPENLAPGVLVRINGILQDVGPDLLAPQFTFQDNTQFKYDGSYAFGTHNVRFGGAYNNIDEAVFASFFGLSPRIRANRNAGTIAFANTNPFSAQGSADPLNFPLNQIVFGNGLGFFSEKPGHGFPFGGTLNHRLGFYGQDSWRATRSLTLNFGLRWSWNSMLSDSDLERAAILGLFDPSLLGKPRRPGDNFGPQAGFAWNVGGRGKTVVRGGAGIFYETNIINNVLFDRPINLPPGFGNDTPVISAGAPLLLHPGTGATLFDFSTQCSVGGGNCFAASLGQVAPDVAAAQAAYQAATASLSAGYPQAGVPPLLNQILSTAGSLVDVNYRTPYGAQMNIGVQQELKPGLVLAVDYVHNRGARFNLVRDRNRLGAANTLDVGIANGAIAATLADFGCADIDCVILNGGTIGDFAGNGLAAGSAVDGFAFRGENPNFRDMGVIESIGLSRFQALQVRLNGVIGGSWGPFRRIHSNVTYQLGRFESTGIDQDFISNAGFNDRPTKFFGPANADRLHQVGLTFLMELPYGFNLNTTTQLRSNLATSLFLPGTTFDADEIFYSDLDGDGVIEDPLPGLTGSPVTPRGAFGRSVNAGNINTFINAYNNTVAGTVLPAGQALIAAGLFTEAQLISLGAVATAIPLAPSDQLDNDNFINTDLRFSNKIKITERVAIEPMMEVFNVFNVANYVAHSSALDGLASDANGTSASLLPADRGLGRRSFGSGSFSPGTQRAFQFGVRVHF